MCEECAIKSRVRGREGRASRVMFEGGQVSYQGSCFVPGRVVSEGEWLVHQDFYLREDG